MDSFKEIFQKHEGRLINKWNHYFDIYDKYFSRYRGKKLNILEIGISHGGSLQLWKEYFGEGVNIYAIDVNPECKKFEEKNVKIFIGSQSDIVFLQSVKKELPLLDIIIDDGGHTMKQQIISFQTLYNHLYNSGVYLIEDTHTSYWYEYGGGLHKKGTFIEYSKSLIDFMYSWHIKYSRLIQPNEITKTINSIHFYDSIVVFEKTTPREKPFSIVKGKETIKDFEEPEIRKKTITVKLSDFIKRIIYKKNASKHL